MSFFSVGSSPVQIMSDLTVVISKTKAQTDQLALESTQVVADIQRTQTAFEGTASKLVEAIASTMLQTRELQLAEVAAQARGEQMVALFKGEVETQASLMKTLSEEIKELLAEIGKIKDSALKEFEAIELAHKEKLSAAITAYKGQLMARVTVLDQQNKISREAAITNANLQLKAYQDQQLAAVEIARAAANQEIAQARASAIAKETVADDRRRIERDALLAEKHRLTGVAAVIKQVPLNQHNCLAHQMYYPGANVIIGNTGFIEGAKHIEETLTRTFAGF